jgi:hypothetical protein
MPRPKPDLKYLDGLARISGPVSLAAYDLRAPSVVRELAGDCEVYVFGDVHASYEGRCRRCGTKACVGIAKFISGLERRFRGGAEGGALDVFMELPYINTRQDAAAVAREVQAVRDILARDRESARPGERATLGVAAKIFREVGAKFHEHVVSPSQEARSQDARFHYADARYEPTTASIFHPDVRGRGAEAWRARFRASLPTSAHVGRMMHAVLFSRRFAEDAAALAEGQGFDVRREFLSSGETKIAKQFYKLPAALRPAVREYLVRRVRLAEACFRDAFAYDRLGALEALSATRPRDFPPAQWHYVEAKSTGVLGRARALGVDALHEACRFGTCVFMDAYLICRLLCYVARRRTRCAVVYVGQYHAEALVDFLDSISVRPALTLEGKGARVRCLSTS